jgi:phenylacetate-coenzyme A ligase PaaK-like adenylate-forming protein
MLDGEDGLAIMPSSGGPRYWERGVERISRRELSQLQRRRLKFILKYVNEKSPFYKRVFKANKVGPGDFNDLADIRKFPFTTKDDLRQYSYPYGGDFLCVPMKRLVGWHMTSGTTGTPTLFIVALDSIFEPIISIVRHDGRRRARCALIRTAIS